MRNYLIIDGNDSRDYGVYISGQGTFNSPARAYENITIPGRNGSLLGFDRRLENVELTYPAFIYANFSQNIERFRNMLLSLDGYVRLVDSYHPDEYRKVFFRGGLEVDATSKNDAGEFDIEFECKPQRYLLTGETTVEVTDSIENPTLFPARPLIRVYGYGELQIGDETVTIADAEEEYIDIDCDLMDVYSGTRNLNAFVTFSTLDFPELLPGENAISYSGDITKVEITPHWWRV